VGSPTILDTIVARRGEDVAAAKAAVPAAALEAKLADAPPVIDFVDRLRRDAPLAVIAEVKRASPSKGDIAPGLDAAEQALRYARGGASAISILTEPTWFKGTLADMAAARAAVDELGPARPAILRKDFIIDEYQLLEARVHGADAVLLIVAALDDAVLRRLYDGARALGMQALVEVNDADEMARAASLGAPLIGINNRDLRSFRVDLATTDRLASLAPPGALLAALSGISSRADVERFMAVGAAAVLVGESLMLAPDPAAKVRELRGIPVAAPGSAP
jgi:anthranilate synthase/indole-3-glycerol phosphate synthase/phosphoribosylanthranilate isomerase